MQAHASCHDRTAVSPRRTILRPPIGSCGGEILRLRREASRSEDRVEVTQPPHTDGPWQVLPFCPENLHPP